jgi:hypothetical protein
LSSFFYAQPVNNFVNLNVAILRDLWFNIRMLKMNVTLKANDQATRRTRNRIAEHGPDFRAVKSGNCPDLGGGLHLLVRTERWQGWLPWDEVNWQSTQGKDFALTLGCE